MGWLSELNNLADEIKTDWEVLKKDMGDIFEEELLGRKKKVPARQITKPPVGSVIGIARGLYKHYGVYIGNNRVVHYSSDEGDNLSSNTIIKTDMDFFMEDSDRFYMLKFDKDADVFNGQETKKRALSQLGKNEYNLISNNCEHFAMWCKTGKNTSDQVALVQNHSKRIYFDYPF
ncbi:MAG: lecithin retinol acyltransferase family protein [Moraxellaceae bacterium]